MFTRFTDALRGARKLEMIIILALLAIMALVLTGKNFNGISTDIESRLERTLKNIDGAGNVQTMITQDSEGKTIGVLVVAEGADSIKVKLDILRAVETLMGTDRENIEVAVMKGD